MINRFTMVGAAALVAAVAILGASLGATSPAVHAGSSAVPSNTPVPANTPCGGVQGTSLNLQVAVCTSTAVAVHSATPTSVPTTVAQNTPVVASATTAPSTSVPVPATATSPAGGSQGAVTGPNTGTGDGTAGGGFPWAIAAGMALAALGMGTLAFGVRRRN